MPSPVFSVKSGRKISAEGMRRTVTSTRDPKAGLATAANAGGVDGAENWRSWDGRRW